MKNLTHKLLVTSCLLVLLSFQVVAQNGTIRGTIIEDSNGEPLFGVTVQIKGTTNGAISDFDGKFEISVPAGEYDIQASFVSFQSVTVTGLVVAAGEVTLIDQINLKEDVELLEEVVITADLIKTTESSLLTVKRKSANLVDGISAASFRKIGDSDAAGAVKRVTGVSVEGGKYVYVRGLGDRYTKTMLNSVDIPGLDPDKNSLQIDIFPTNLINNMVVLKTALAEMPADFTGGVVNIETKDFPEEKILDVSFGMTYNPSMHLNDEYINYAGSDTDFLGFDTDTRDIPVEARDFDNVPSVGDPDAVNDFTRSFNPWLGVQNATSFVDYSFGVSLGNQKALKNGNKLGYIFSGTYKSSTKFYDDVVYGEYQISQPTDEFDLILATEQSGVLGEHNILLGGLGGLAYKTNNSKYRLTLMHLQNGESKAGRFSLIDDPDGVAAGKSGFSGISENLYYGERGLTNMLLNGEHHLDNDRWTIDWRISPTISSIEDPDIRRTAFTNFQGGFIISAGAAGLPSRAWRFLDEINIVGKVDVTREYVMMASEAKLKFGFSHVFKERDYEIIGYNLQGTNGFEYSGDPNELLTRDNIFPNGADLRYTSANINPNPNQYNSSVQNFSVYVSNEFNVIPALKSIIGLRAENYVQRHTGRDILYAQLGEGENNLEDDKVLDALDLFPSLNLVYQLKERQNLRFSYSKTIARPSFKELSFAQIIDPITNRIFNGGLFPFEGDWDGNLSETRINNLDLRWELFPSGSELLSVSFFHKSLTDVIELVRIPTALTNNEFQPRNVGNGRVLGVEMEFRKNLAFVFPSLKNFNLNGNVTLVDSQIDMTEVEFNNRSGVVKEGQVIADTRAMAGQAPYIVNVGLGYENFALNLDAGFFYNVKGSTLTVVGGGTFPDVFSEPFHSLNFNLNKTIGENENLSLNFSISNILNDVREEFFQGFNAVDQYFERRSPGTSIGLGLGYKF